MFGINDSSLGGDIGEVVGDDISNLTQPQNSFQRWQTTAAGGGLVGAGRPQISDYFTQAQLRNQITGQIGNIPGADIRSAADRPGGDGLGSGFASGGLSLGGKMDSESAWRGFFGAKQTPGTVASGTPGLPSVSGGISGGQPLGMHSVMAAQRYASNLLHSFSGSTPQSTF